MLAVLLLTSAPSAAPGEAAFGPAPRDADGRFANPDRIAGHGSLAVRLPFFLRRVAGAFGVPGRTVVAGQATSSTGALTSSLIQSFSPGDTLVTCTSSVERLANGNYAYTITCTNNTGEPLEFEIDAQPLDCCEGTDAEGNPNQLRCDVEVVVSGTPCDLGALIDIDKPVVRAAYEFAEAGEPGLGSLVDAFLKKTKPG